MVAQPLEEEDFKLETTATEGPRTVKASDIGFQRFDPTTPPEQEVMLDEAVIVCTQLECRLPRGEYRILHFNFDDDDCKAENLYILTGEEFGQIHYQLCHAYEHKNEVVKAARLSLLRKFCESLHLANIARIKIMDVLLVGEKFRNMAWTRHQDMELSQLQQIQIRSLTEEV